MIPLADQCIWITGASSGIGEALAYALSREGARLILSARREEALRRVRRGCERPDRHLVAPLDLLDMDRLAGASREVMDQAGPLDILINNAGVSQRARALETPLDIDRRIMELNYFAAVALTKEVAPAMVRRKRGHIVSISSAVGMFGTPWRSAYAASKHALHGFMDSLRAEIEDHGVAVTLICPGFVRTNISRLALTSDGDAHGVEDAGQSRGMDAYDCAERIVGAIRRRRPELYIGGPEITMIYLKRFLPGLYRRLIRRVKVT